MNQTQNIFIERLKKFYGKDVIVKDKEFHTFNGKCRAIDFFHLNVILDNGSKIILIRNMVSMSMVKVAEDDKRQDTL